MIIDLKHLATGLALAFLPCLIYAQQPVPTTARRALQFAEPAALSWAVDAVLVLVGTGSDPGMFGDGTADIWNFAYYSAAKNSARTFFADKVRLIHQEPPASQLPSLQPIGNDWMDSDAVAHITENRGGAGFRARHSDVKVLAAVSFNIGRPANAKLWVVTYVSQPDAALFKFKLAVGSGFLIPLDRSVQTNPPLGENLTFLDEQDDTLAVVNLQSGNLDSLVVEAFPGILPDTTHNEKTVPRFYNVAAYPAGTAFAATLTLHYTQAEFDASGASSESGLKLFRNDGAAWQLVGGVADPQRNLVTVTGVTQFSSWAFADPQDQVLSVEQTAPSLPEVFLLRQNYPNPFNPETQIRYRLLSDGDVTLAIYNPLGQLVRMLVNGHQPSGEHTVTWNARDRAGKQVASGIYVCQLSVGEFAQSRKMVLIR